MKKSIKILISIVIIIFIVATAGFFYIKSIELPNIEIKNINIKDINDGSYIGEYEAGPVKAVVKVEVIGNKIKDIKIEKHECGLGKKAEKITDEIESLQTLQVDEVSGATLSSKVILKAVEIALEKGKE
ncbi:MULTISPECIES: FMN-binding protein [unclassified Clostridium]|uniref:FMN-binding protein n=1 Tax=unclassified Clostridium TaxID=2614128 RepID=UPI0025C5E6A0|nr:MULTISPECIES: FMN-binding protein [unclassified Clostridium]